MAMMKCPECGHDVSSSADFCPNCGYKLKTNSNATKTENKLGKIYERNQRHRWIANIVGCAFSIVLGVVSFCMCGIKIFQEIPFFNILFIVFGIIFLVIGIIGIIYYAYRLKNY